MHDGIVLSGLTGLVLVLVILYFALWLYVLLPASMARKRGRGALEWVLLCILISPILAIPLLWLLGDNPDSRRKA